MTESEQIQNLKTLVIEKERRIEALEQWQKEAVAHLNYLNYINEKEDNPYRLLEYDEISLRLLIKEAEEK